MRWNVVSAVTALIVAAFAYLVASYPEYYKLWSVLGLFGVAFGFMLLRNPRYRYMRLASWITAVWMAASAVPNIKAAFLISNEAAGAIGLENQPGWAFHVSCALTVLACVALDYLANRENSTIRLLLDRVHLRFGGQYQTVAGGTAIQVGDVSGQATVNVHPTDISRELDYVKALLEKGKPDAAEEHLLRLKRDHELSMSVQQQFRLQAYFGKAFHDRGEASKAVIHYENAFRLRPNDEGGQEYGLLAKLMAGNTEQAHKNAVEFLQMHPGSSLATAIMIRSAPRDVKAAALACLIDCSVIDDVDVLSALVTRFIFDNDAASAESYARKALAKLPDHPAVVGNVGQAIVLGEAKVAARRFWEGPLDESARRRIDEAIGFLTTAIESSQLPAEARGFRSRRGLARELLGQLREAEADFLAALEGDRTCQDTANCYASFLAHTDRGTDALAVLRPVIGDATAIGIVLSFCFLAFEFGAISDKEEALTYLRRANGRLAEASSQQRDEAFRLMALITNELHGHSAAQRLCAEFPVGGCSEVARAEVEAVILHNAGNEEAANIAATVAQQALSDGTAISLRLQVARIMRQLSRFADELAILRPMGDNGQIRCRRTHGPCRR